MIFQLHFLNYLIKCSDIRNTNILLAIILSSIIMFTLAEILLCEPKMIVLI